MTVSTTTRPPSRTRWRVPAALVAFSAVPALGGALRMAQLTSGGPVAPADARFAQAPVPIVLHIIGATVFCVLGAFQFAPSLREGRSWHRLAGRVLAPCGIVAGLSGVWMALTYPHPVHDGELLLVFRVLFGSAMAFAVVLAVAAIRRRDVTGHRAWMIRGYAIGQGAGSQAVAFGVWTAAVGPPEELARALLMGASWLVNLAVAEWIVHREGKR